MPPPRSLPDASDVSSELIPVPLFICPMANETVRRPPDLSECSTDAEPAITDNLRAAWRKRQGPDLEVTARTGPGAAAVVVVVGTARRAAEIFAFARGSGTGIDGPLAIAIDTADALLSQLIAGKALRSFLPLDWEGTPLKGSVVFVRGEVREYAAEAEAAILLQEELPPGAIKGFPKR